MSEMKWTRIAEKTPPLEEYVLCLIESRDDGYRHFVGRLCKDDGKKYWCGPGDFDIYLDFEVVSHWTTLGELIDEVD